MLQQIIHYCQSAYYAKNSKINYYSIMNHYFTFSTLLSYFPRNVCTGTLLLCSINQPHHQICHKYQGIDREISFIALGILEIEKLKSMTDICCNKSLFIIVNLCIMLKITKLFMYII